MSAEMYFQEVEEILDDVYRTQLKNIKEAARMIAEASMNEKTIYAFGANHAGLLAQELYYRSGGLAIINPLRVPGLSLDAHPVTVTTSMERMDGFGRVVIENYGLVKGDVLIVHSVSGRNHAPVDIALSARRAGVGVIALTNVEYSTGVDSRHPSGKRLFEVGDLVIDNCGCPGDAAVEIKGLAQKVAPTSTAVGATILNAMVAEVVAIFQKEGVTPPVFISSNVDGGDEHNEQILDMFSENIKYI